jgi:hypothetical protein
MKKECSKKINAFQYHWVAVQEKIIILWHRLIIPNHRQQLYSFSST